MRVKLNDYIDIEANSELFIFFMQYGKAILSYYIVIPYKECNILNLDIQYFSHLFSKILKTIISLNTFLAQIQ